jgi:hypothetical protein
LSVLAHGSALKCRATVAVVVVRTALALFGAVEGERLGAFGVEGESCGGAGVGEDGGGGTALNVAGVVIADGIGIGEGVEGLERGGVGGDLEDFGAALFEGFDLGEDVLCLG